MKKIILATLGLVLALPAQAQNAVVQEGTVLQNSAIMFRGDRRVRQGAGAVGASVGQIIEGGTGVVGGVCDFSGPTDTSGGYDRLCLDAANGRVVFESTKAVPPGLVFNILGSDYSFFGVGNGNVSGPTPTIINELASWNSLVGGALRQGAARLTDNKTGALAAVDAAGLEVKSQTAASAQQVFSCILHPTCASTPANYDALRGVAVNPNGSLNLLTNGVASYVMNSATRANPVASNPYPVTVNFFGASICDADNCGVWGINTVLGDSRGSNPSVHGPRYLFNELDFQVTSVQTQVSGLNFTGASTAQPSYAVATACLTLDQASGTIAKWSSCHTSVDGATTTFASIGAQAATGVNINSQNLTFGFRDGAGLGKATTMAASPSGVLVVSTSGIGGSIILGTAASSFYTTTDNSGLVLNNRGSVLASANRLLIGSDVNWTSVELGSGSGPISLFGTRIEAGTAFLHNVKTVATLPACAAGTKYHEYTVSDATAPAYNTNVVGGGAVAIKVMCDGANWKAS